MDLLTILINFNKRNSEKEKFNRKIENLLKDFQK